MNISRLIITAIVFAILSGPVLASKNKKVTICHEGETITISKNALNAHLNNHGDTTGECPVPEIKIVIMMRCLNVDGVIQVSGVSSSYDYTAIQPVAGEQISLSCAEEVARIMNDGYKLKDVNTGLIDGETEYLFLKKAPQQEVDDEGEDEDD